MNLPNTTSAPVARIAHAVLVQSRRAAAHDLNNLLAVVQGNLQLLQRAEVELPDSIVSEIDLACTRMALLCDGWQLADPEGLRSVDTCAVWDVVQEVAALARSTQDVQVTVTGTARAGGLSVCVDRRTLRAVGFCTMGILAQASGRAPQHVHIATRNGWCLLHVSTACRPDRVPGSVPPEQHVALGGGVSRRMGVGLWDVSEALAHHGGTVRVRHRHGVLHVRLLVPA